MPVSVLADERAFFDTLYDVPVMAGLTEIPDMAMVFDKPDGKISQAGAAMGQHSAPEVRAFYDETLPQLGWKALGEGNYRREGEVLALSFEDPKMVKFLLKPQ